MNKKNDGVGHRLVMHFPGFEPVPPKLHYIRFKRECRKFRKLWNVQQDFGPYNEADGASNWQTTTHGKDWAMSTRIVVLEWCSILDYPAGLRFWHRIFAGLHHLFAHFTTFTVWRYFVASWRYGLTCIYPFITFFLAAIFSLVSVWAVDQLAGGLPFSLSIFICLVVFIIIFKEVGQRWGVPMALEFSHHAYSISLPENNIFQSHIAKFSALVIKEIKATKTEEINITTHSIGSVYGVVALARALRQTPDLLMGKTLYFTAIASSMLHVALMSRCQWLRDDLKLVLGHCNIQWIEIYAINDPLSFNKCSPASVIDGTPANAVISQRVRFSRMIDKNRYRFMRYNFFRLHRQMIMANDQRYFYDFYLLLFGPRNIVNLLQRKPISEI